MFDDCDGCKNRRDQIIAAWDFGDFFWSMVAAIFGAVILGLPIVAAMLHGLRARGL